MKIIKGLVHNNACLEVEYDNGRKEWTRNGLNHREDGTEKYFINGNELTKFQVFNLKLKDELGESLHINKEEKVKKIKV